MPLILAIEPDRRQASQLKKLVKSVGAELVLADTTERALDAIGNRLPDLVLVPALLSPQDDAALATALRVIATAAHVQTLTIPVFAAPTARPQGSGGVLGMWRRDRSQAAAPEGCNPGLFAEQIAEYLAEAAAARAARGADADDHEPPAVTHLVEPIAPATSFDLEPWLETAADEVAHVTAAYEAVVAESDPAVRSFEPEPEQHVDHAAEPRPKSAFEWHPIVSKPQPFEATPDAPADAGAVMGFDPSDIDLGAFIAELEEKRRREAVTAVDSEPESIELFSAIGDPIAAVDAWVPVEEPPVGAASEEASEPAPDAIAEFESWMTSPLAPQRAWPKLGGAAAEPPTVAPEARAEEPEATFVVELEPAPSDWIDMLEALRRDIDRLRVERTEVSVPAAAAEAAATEADAAPTPSRKKKRKKEVRPVQDEWGFFDPEQCGFTALLAKLDEISQSNDDSDNGSP